MPGPSGAQWAAQRSAMPDRKNAAESWRAPGTGSPTSATRPSRSGDDLHVLSRHVFLAAEQPVVAVAFPDRGDEPVHEHTLALRAPVLLLDLRTGHPAQDRVQHVVVAGDGGLRAAEHLTHHVVGACCAATRTAPPRPPRTAAAHVAGPPSAAPTRSPLSPGLGLPSRRVVRPAALSYARSAAAAPRSLWSTQPK
jgi:hypothetical protein